MTAEQIAEWDAELSALTGSMGYLFNRPEPRLVFAQFIEGLLAELPKKNGWTLSERAGHAGADRMQWLLNGSVWDADRLRDAVRGYLIDDLGDPEASLVIDDTQAQKKGTKSVGVAYQHCGLTGDVRNCQTMVMLSYAAESGQHAFIDRRLYCPRSGRPTGRGAVRPGYPNRSTSPPSPSWPLPCSPRPGTPASRSPGCWPTPATAVTRSCDAGATRPPCPTSSASRSICRSTGRPASRGSRPSSAPTTCCTTPSAAMRGSAARAATARRAPAATTGPPSP
ncbi:transposase [Streptomyces sp. ISL-100]|nr:transposase [Streptomyces sp. ISL-100]